MPATERRTILGSLLALLATPLLAGRSALTRTLAVPLKENEEGDGSSPIKITPPAHSVKRRG